MKRLTLRLNNVASNALQRYKIIFNMHHKNISYNQIINILIYAKLPQIKISQKYINYFLNFKHESDQFHSKKFYQNYTIKLAKLTNAINVITRQIKGVANNINQITHVANINGANDDNLAKQLSDYQNNMQNLIKFCVLLSRKLVILWQM